MKLMIDIDDKLYKQALRDQCYHEVTGLNDINDYSLTVANGIPVLSEDDLINRSVLKQAFEKVYPLATNEMGGAVNKRIYDIIDNAPAANIPQGKWHEGFHEGFNAGIMLTEAFNERPQGEWKSLGFVHSRGYAWCTCSNCGKTTKIYLDKDNDFCCIADIRNKAVSCLFCGADMQKGGTE